MTDTPNTVEETTEDTTAQDELASLKGRADVMGVKYHPSIGVDALRAKVKAALEGEKAEPAAEEVKEEPKLSKAQYEAKLRQDMRKEQMKLIRLRITNLNPAKKELHGEILTVANKYLGAVSKFIPFGEATEEGYHVPYILYKQLKARKFLHIRTRRNKRTGEIQIEQKWVPEFALEILPQLTEEELKQLAATQAAAGAID